jgi:hypothetical protein
MALLLETITPEARILSEEVDERTGDRTLRIAVKWQHCGIVNGNRRRYSAAIMKREIERLSPLIRQGRIMGCSFHPDNEAEVNDVSHLWESIEMNSAGICTGVVKVLPTAKGKDVQVIARAGGFLGMSSRGTGTVTPKEETINGKVEKFEEVNEDFHLKSPGDFVLSPSVVGAGVLKVMEAQINEPQAPTLEQFSSDLAPRLDEAVVRRRLEGQFREAILAGWQGDFDSFRRMKEEAVETKITEGEPCGPDGELFMTPEQEKLFREAIESGFLGTPEELFAMKEN